MQCPRLVLSLGLTILVSSCSVLPFDPASESQKLLRRDAEWADLATAGKDVERIASYWSDDAIIIPQGQPIVEGKAAIIAVLDNGPGIAPEVLPRVFDPFFTTKPPGEGSGLGLSVSYGIVSEHGGRLWAENRPEGGAAFYIELPLEG